MTNVQVLLGTYKKQNGDAEPVLTITSIDNPQNAIGNITGTWSGQIGTDARESSSSEHLDYTVSGSYVINEGKLFMTLGGQNSIPNNTPVNSPALLSASVSITGYIEVNTTQNNLQAIVAYAQIYPGYSSGTYQSFVALVRQ